MISIDHNDDDGDDGEKLHCGEKKNVPNNLVVVFSILTLQNVHSENRR